MHIGGSDFLFLIVFVIFMLLCIGVGKFSQSKGRSFVAGFLLAFLTSPLLGVIILWLMPPPAPAIEPRRGNRVER